MTAHHSPIGALAPITPEDRVADRTAELLTYTRTQKFDRRAIEYRFIPDAVDWCSADLLDLRQPPETSS